MSGNGRTGRLDRLERLWPTQRRQGTCPACMNDLDMQVIIGDGPPHTCSACGRVLDPVDGHTAALWIHLDDGDDAEGRR